MRVQQHNIGPPRADLGKKGCGVWGKKRSRRCPNAARCSSDEGGRRIISMRGEASPLPLGRKNGKTYEGCCPTTSVQLLPMSGVVARAFVHAAYLSYSISCIQQKIYPHLPMQEGLSYRNRGETKGIGCTQSVPPPPSPLVVCL